MKFSVPFRRTVQVSVAALLLSAGMYGSASQRKFMYDNGPHLRPMAGQQRAGAAPGPHRNQEHLAQWMQRHSNLPIADQQRALENEPGFRDLPPQTQERMLNRLNQLNNMTPEKRRRLIDRTEAMERLTVPQRQQVRGAMQELGSLPQDRRRMVARTFRDLRDMPQPQRQAFLNSDQFQGQFSEQERDTLSSLLAVEPYLPAPHPNEGQTYGK